MPTGLGQRVVAVCAVLLATVSLFECGLRSFGFIRAIGDLQVVHYVMTDLWPRDSRALSGSEARAAGPR